MGFSCSGDGEGGSVRRYRIDDGVEGEGKGKGKKGGCWGRR